MKTKYFILPLMLMLVFMMTATVSAASSVTISNFFDATSGSSLTINNGDSVGVIISADSVFESSMTINVDLLDSSGSVVSNLLNTVTTLDSYSKHLTFGLGVYPGPGSYTIKSTVVAASGQTATKSLSLTVLSISPTNHLPVITSTPITSVNEGNLYSYDVNANDADGDTLTYSLTQKPTWLSINSATGLISGSAPQVSSDTQYIVTVDVSDGKGAVNQTFTIDVLDIVVPPTNHAPVAQSQSVTTNKNSNLGMRVSATDADGDSLTYSIVTSPSHGTISGFNANTGILSYTPSTDYVGTDSFTFKANDGTLDSNVATISITVNATTSTNNAPFITSSPVLSVNECGNYSYDVNANDADGDVLTYSLSITPSWLSINSSTGVISGIAPQVSADESHLVTVLVSDGKGGADTQTFQVIVHDGFCSILPPNSPPVINTSPVLTVNENTNYVYDVNASDAENDTLTYSLTAAPGWLSINSVTGLISGIAPSVSADTGFSVSISVDDGHGGIANQIYTLTVLDTSGTGSSGGASSASSKKVSGSVRVIPVDPYDEAQYEKQFEVKPVVLEDESSISQTKGFNWGIFLIVLLFLLLAIVAVAIILRMVK